MERQKQMVVKKLSGDYISFKNTYKGIGEAGGPQVKRQQMNGHCIEP
jgi:hypothetical protein